MLPPYAQSSDFYAIHNTTIGLGEQRMFSARMGKETDKTGYDFHSGVRGRIVGVASCTAINVRSQDLAPKFSACQGTKAPKHVNTRAKAAMMIGVDRHRKYVPESQRYYEKKRSEGKKHNQAIRALGRHLGPIIYKMLTEEREYQTP